MENQLYKINDICQSYKIETTFIHELHVHGLIEIQYIESQEYLHEEQLPQVEKYYTWHHELELNFPALDVVQQLLVKINDLQEKVRLLNNQ
ncbi:chaperone modulator CbpM [Sphingobacterium rhinopitheci]|uniref:chaperone modulator CbpM n=1 Tax=Sphingobacterium rhinopitheci TaxID=2781960 RepID=UPI001F5167E3|nr:chaperone modulator CbpM [Sphingobacterium rhinopitheci]MCI0921690.1 MerR family transcriptional regulator [Sphingobacterium rhinopitheci]